MATILVTGGAGFIGSNLVSALLERGDQVVAIDNFNDFYDPAVKHRNIEQSLKHKNFTLVEADICDREAVKQVCSEHKPTAIAHLAAYAGVRPSLENPELYIRNNVEGTTSMLEAARTLKGVNFVLASSSSVYGGSNQTPFVEDMDVDEPISVYAATKRACEILAHTYHKLYSMDIWCIRFFTCYGPAQRPDLAIHAFTRAIDSGESITMFGDGATTRDYLYIDDCVQGVIAAIERCKGYEIINLGEEQRVRLDQLIEVISKELGKPAKIKQEPIHPGDMLHTHSDVSKARKILGYRPSMTIEEGVRKFVEWYRAVNKP